MFLDTAQIQIHQLNTAIFVVLSCKNNLIVYNIKYTYLSAFRSLVGSEWTFQGLRSVRALLNGKEWKFVGRAIGLSDFCVTRQKRLAK